MRLVELLHGTIPPDIIGRFSGHFEVIGTIAVISLPPEILPYKIPIADAILALRKDVCTVLMKVHPVRSSARTAGYEILAGDTTVTEYREGGCRYRFDLARVFFSGRLAHERMRVAGLVRPGERILVPFCGVGPFAIPAAIRGASVVAVEQNPDAVFWFRENLRLNGVSDAVLPIEGDVQDTARLPGGLYERLIIPAPYGMDAVFTQLAPCVQDGGWVHWYTFKAENEIPALLAGFRDRGFVTEYYRPCGNVAPGISRWVFDLRKRDDV